MKLTVSNDLFFFVHETPITSVLFMSLQCAFDRNHVVLMVISISSGESAFIDLKHQVDFVEIVMPSVKRVLFTLD